MTLERFGPFCIDCEPEEFPTGLREVELHLSPRFGDDRRPVYRYARVYHNGELLDAEMKQGIVEVRPGHPGYAILLAHPRVCPACRSIHAPLRTILRGNIEVRIEDVELERLPTLWTMPFPAPRVGATLADVNDP